MKIAYLILAHKNLNQVAYFLNLLTLGNNDNICFIHIDARIDLCTVSVEVKRTFALKNVFIIPNRIQVNWGSFSMIEATLVLLKSALQYAVKFDYFSLHSGQDLPIRSNNYISSYLELKNGTEFLEFSSIPNVSNWNGNGGLDRLEYYWFVDEIGFEQANRLSELQKNAKVKKHKPIEIKNYYGGSQWWTLTHNCIAYTYDKIMKSSEIQNFFKYSFIPDETIFHTIILNSPFRDSVQNSNLRYIDWKSGPYYPKVLCISDITKIKRSLCLYARKFDITTDSSIFKEINNLIINDL